MTPRQRIEPNFSVEGRIVRQRELALPAQPDFLFIHLLNQSA
jgi:hypothetical protein